MKRLIFTGILLLAGLTLWSQTKVELTVDKPEKITLELFSDIDGKKILDLPVALQLTNTNNLVVMFGNGEMLTDGVRLWLFSSPKRLEALMKNDKNISATKEFKRRYNDLDMFYHVPANNMQYIRAYEFDNSYEIVSRNPKPAFFKIDKNAKGIGLFLTIYVSKPDKKFQDLFFAKAKKVELNIKINN